MALNRGTYRLISLDGNPHPVMDGLYESMESALKAAQDWSNGQGMRCSLSQRAIGIEVLTSSGSWRTIEYSSKCLAH